LEKITLILTLVSITIGILAIYMAYPEFIQTPQLEILGFTYDKYEHSMGFAISNLGKGIAYVNKIELKIQNFEIHNQCTPNWIFYMKYIKELIEPIEIEMKSGVYELKNIITYKEEEGQLIYKEVSGGFIPEIEKIFPISEGLVYSKGEVDGFYLPYYILNDTQYYYEPFSFDANLRIYWCDFQNCNEQVKESKIIHVEFLRYCPNEEK